VETGRRAIGFLGGPGRFSSGRERAAGFRAAMAEHGLSPVFVAEAEFSVEGGAEAAERLVREHPGLDAVICGNDAIAIGLLNALRHRLGRRVPEDIAIVGYDNVPAAAWPGIDLSTVNNPIPERVAEICRLVARRIADPDAETIRTALEPHLIVRSTS
jgi:DNA-binding LacI/PurR family transcriptional regulator